MKKKTIVDFIPFFVSVVVTVICLIVYFCALKRSDYLNVVKACMVPVCALVVPVVNLIFKIRIPFAFNIAVAAFAVCGLDFASVLDFYKYVPYYDKFLHTAFGIVGSFGAMIVLLYGKGERMKPWCFFLVIMLCVLGLAAFWEIFEYVIHAITGADMQHWTPDLGSVGNQTVNEFFESYNPLWDTIWDMIVAAIGVLLFYGIIFIDKLCKYRMCKGIYKQVNFRSKPKEKTEE
ncbi:MAG: DUF2238 domain-containing protein [Clostridia bacterium]|nr:DUF2238 domain-containing protein [Clostridia bacterium]